MEAGKIGAMAEKQVIARPTASEGDAPTSEAEHAARTGARDGAVESPWDELADLGVDVSGLPDARSGDATTVSRGNNNDDDGQADDEAEEAGDEEARATDAKRDGEADDAEAQDQETAEADEDETAEEEATADEAQDDTTAAEDEEDEAEGTLAAVFEKALKKRGVSQKLIKRIANIAKRELAQREELTQQANELRETRTQLQVMQERPPVTVAASATDPLTDVFDEQTLEQRVEAANAWLEFAEDNPNGGHALINGVQQELTEDEVKAYRRSASRVLKAEPARRQFLKDRQDRQAAARKAHPTLFQPGHADAQERERLLKQVPELLRLPEADELIAHYLRGRTIAAEEATGKVKYQRIAVGTGNKATGAKPKPKPNGKQQEAFVERPQSGSGRAVVTPADHRGGTADQLWRQAKSEQGVDAEALMEAW